MNTSLRTAPGHILGPAATELMLALEARYGREAEGLLAQCIQHELGHLDGQLYIDLLSELKRSRLLKKLQKAEAGET